MKRLKIFSNHHHEPAQIIGDREALLELSAQILKAYNTGQGRAVDFYDADGEAYDVLIKQEEQVDE